jgi:hypothetical protein
MTVAVGERKISIGIIAAAVGGVLAVIQAFLTWESVTYGAALSAFGASLNTKSSIVGLDANQGKIILALGIVAIALAAAVIAQVKIPNVSAILVVVGVIMIAFAVIGIFNAMSDMNDFNTSLDSIKSLVDTSGTAVSIGIGLIVAFAAGVLVLLGGALGLVKKSA